VFGEVTRQLRLADSPHRAQRFHLKDEDEMRNFDRQAKLLRNARESRGLTQRQLADALKFSSAQMISNWERALCGPPLKSIPKLCKILGINRRDLILKVMADKRDAIERMWAA
jgi:ribosome-binding protein aMBF1 (putative translation factor)